MKKFYLFVTVVAWWCSFNLGYSQGCVSIRNMVSGTSTLGMPSGSWQFSANYRYFRSFRHFSGTEENPDRVTDNTEVVNNDNALTLGASYTMNDRWTVSAFIPFLYIDRSSLYEHDRVSRHVSTSKGLGDMRLIGYYSVRPMKGKASLQLGAGFKLPTGNYNYKDDFHTVNGIEERPVDQSIQPGDGGLGIITEARYMQHLSDHLSLYLDGMYMFNPRNTNGTRTSRETLSPILQNEAIMSVADQYFLRLGGQYVFNKKLGLTLGARLEGIPVEDIIGDSEGFRRPGLIASIEPGIFYQVNAHTFSANVPIAIVRKRAQSLTDKETEIATGNPRTGDAAFANYLLSVSYAYRLSKKVF